MTRRLSLLTPLVLLWCCSSALAAFPGRDGQLAVQPVTGGGIVLERPDGTHAARICTTRSLCGTPSAPSFSPNGQGLVFRDARTGQIEIVAPDGTCLWCLHGAKLAATPSMDPTFASGTAVIAVTRGGELSRVSLTGARSRRVAAGGRVTAAVSSSRGGLAVVRAGWIFVRAGRSLGLGRLVRGSDPDWSPTGRFLAFAHSGSVWTVKVSTGTREGGRLSSAPPPIERRLAAGSHPTWSPAGTRIAFIARDGRVDTIGSGGAGRRTVGSVRGRAVSWQPRPRTPTRCTGATGSVLARSTTSILRQQVSSPPMGGLPSWHGCLRLLGAPRRLSSGELDDNGPSVSGAGVAGRFSALGLGGAASEDVQCDSRVELFDNATGRNVFRWFAPGDREQCHEIAPVVVDSSGFAAWKVMSSAQLATGLTAVSCPSAGLCVAADQNRNVFTSTDPRGGQWTMTALPRTDNIVGAVTSLSCPTTSFCAVATDYGVFTTTDPTGGPAAWTFTPLTVPPTPQGIVQHLGQVSCATALFCAVVSDVESASHPTGTILTSTNPTGGPAAWTASYQTTQHLFGLSCPSTSLCLTTTGTTKVITSTNPAATQPVWTSETLGAQTEGVACQSDSLCFLEAARGTSLLASTNPAGGASAWNPVLTTSNDQDLRPPSCASAGLCVAIGDTPEGNDKLYTSTNPTAPGSWAATQLTARDASGSSCPSDGLCAIVDDGHAFVSSDPGAGGSSYTSTPIDGPPCFLAGSDCISESLYAHDDTGTHLIDTSTLGNTDTIDHLTLHGNVTTLTWTHAGQLRSLALR